MKDELIEFFLVLGYLYPTANAVNVTNDGVVLDVKCHGYLGNGKAQSFQAT